MVLFLMVLNQFARRMRDQSGVIGKQVTNKGIVAKIKLQANLILPVRKLAETTITQ